MSGSVGHIVSYLTQERMEPSRMVSYAVSTVLLAVLINWTIRIVQLIRRRLRDAEALKDFPGPKGHWFWGNLREAITPEDRFTFSENLLKNKEYSKACVVRLTPFLYNLRLSHPESLKVIMGTTEPKDRFGYGFLVPWIGEGLLISTGHRWARNRRLLTPAFHFDILKPYINIFSRSSTTMSNKLNSILKHKEGSVELFEHVSLMTFDSLMKCIFGDHKDFQVEGFRHPYVQGVYEVAKLIQQRFQRFWHHNDLMYSLSWNGYKFRRACAKIHTYSQKVISEKRQKHHANGLSKLKEDPVDFLDMLLQAKDEDGTGLTDEEIQAEVDTFMFEGHDTTASGISWCLYNLARHPEYQAKCRDEVNNVLGDRDHFSWGDVHKLPFLTMCIKESLRLHPAVPGVGRETTKPLTLPDGRTIPAGIFVTIGIFSCHHNPEVWENPKVYDPYRFTPENSKGRSPHAFIPFSAGPRNCIGQHFAMHEMKVSVGQVLRHFELFEDTDRPVIRDPLLVLRAKYGLYVKAKPIGQ